MSLSGVDITLKEASKYFGNVKAIDNLTLRIKSGELLVLLGPSGCGKTTTLRLIAGLERLTKGYIYIGDELVDDSDRTFVPPRFRKVSMVFQSYALFPHMRVFDNIAFPARVAKQSENEIKKRVYELAEMFDIRGLLDRKPAQLSAGQQQRVALARALMIEPKILLLDEPLANLDAKLRVSARIMIRKTQRKFGCTTIYVTHDQAEAMAIADRIAVMKDGQIQQIGTPEELYNRPLNTFIADFIGSPAMNLIDCTVDKTAGVFDFGPFKVNIPHSILEALEKYEEVIFGIRPEHLNVSRKPSTVNSLEFEVVTVEKHGDRYILILDKEGIQLTAVISPDVEVNMGDRIWIDFDFKRVHIYDKKTGSLII